jgi:hypothetical protein
LPFFVLSFVFAVTDLLAVESSCIF